MKTIYRNTFLYWFVLLVVALLNATLRELTYKPLLTPFIGHWAHEISAFTAILFFALLIYIYIKKHYSTLTLRTSYTIGFIWMVMTIGFEIGMGLAQGKTFGTLLSSYAFWNGNMWIFVILSLLFLPVIFYNILAKKSDK